MDGLVHVLEFAAPYSRVRSHEAFFGGLLRFGHGAGQVAAADAELDSDQSLALFASDGRSATPHEAALVVRKAMRVERHYQVSQPPPRHDRRVVVGGVEAAAAESR